MPDATDQRLPGEIFVQNVAALVPRPRLNLNGGIMSPDHYSSYIVNIRPTRWRETLWIGKIDNYLNAQFIADAVYYYIGHPSFHFKNANFKFPPLKCKGTSTPLTSREMCFQYATSIARGLKSQRLEFKEIVTRLVLEEVKSPEAQRVLQQFRDESGTAVIVGSDEDVDDEEEVVQSAQSMVLASPTAVDRNVEGENALVPGFDMSDSGFHLQSDLTPVEFLWVDSCLVDMEDHHWSPNHEGEHFCSATRVLGNSFNCPSAFENFQMNFFAMEDAAID